MGLLLTALPQFSAAQSQSRGDASLRLEYQNIQTGDYRGSGLVFDYWTTDSHVALLAGDYALSERWTVSAALPYVRKRFVPAPWDPNGGDPHNPNDSWWIRFQPPDKRFIDDGQYHGDYQDLSLGLSYRLVDGPAWTVSPFIGWAIPVSDYPFYAKAAIGTNLWNIPLGVDVRYVPYFSDWDFRGNVAYVFSEQPLGYNVDYWLAHLSSGYWFKPNFSVDIFLSAKHVRDGLKIPFDFSDNPAIYPAGFDTIEWWQHDRLTRKRLLHLGVGFDYSFNEHYQVSGSYYSSLWADQTNEVDHAFTLALTRYFSGD